MLNSAYLYKIKYLFVLLLCTSTATLALTNNDLSVTKIKRTEYINQQKRNPFLDTSPTNRKTQPLNNKTKQNKAFINQMHLIGTVKLGDNIWAIIKDNNGNLFRVKQGDVIGSEKATITYIRNNSVKLIKQQGDIQKVWILKLQGNGG
jgi:Tfp pilus assembly protein PilP